MASSKSHQKRRFAIDGPTGWNRMHTKTMMHIAKAHKGTERALKGWDQKMKWFSGLSYSISSIPRSGIILVVVANSRVKIGL
jgi:hypothetical protein